jgi:putative transcriptional regulator
VPLDAFSEFDPYAGRRPPESLRGWLLVATPGLGDPNFARTVLLVLDHGSFGAMGVVLNRPGGIAVEEFLPRWHAAAVPPAELFTGGPVARNAVIGLVRLQPGVAGAPGSGTDPDTDLAGAGAGAGAGAPEGWRLLIEGERPVGTVDLGTDPAPLGPSIAGARLFSGYAGWETGQLEGEIAEGSWYAVPAEERDPMSADPEGLWSRVLRRQGGALALVAGFPDDVAAN